LKDALVDQLSVDAGPRGRIEIAQDETPTLEADLGMSTRDVGIGENQMVVQLPPERHQGFVERKVPLPVDDQKGACRPG